jgi:3-methylfumaryl-CoA hydratase
MTTHTISELLVPGPTKALAALLEVEPAEDHIPPLWHWVHLQEMAPQHLLGPDGHPMVGIPEPPGADRKRMFAGGRVTTLTPLRYGIEATRTIMVTDRTVKEGASGTLEFVTVRHEVVQAGQVAVVEEQDIVYRDASSTTSSRPAAPNDESPPPSWILSVDERFLFRFSALTYNAHRIHYDAGWAAREGYDGLVIHGPLQALAMADAARQAGENLVGLTFSFRLQRPMIGTQDMSIIVSTASSEAFVRGADGVVTARGSWR